MTNVIPTQPPTPAPQPAERKADTKPWIAPRLESFHISEETELSGSPSISYDGSVSLS
jgi:hypothetical protein